VAKRILVPLDQSLTAEAVIPLVADAARGGGATVRLLHVAPAPRAQTGMDGRGLAGVDQENEGLESEGLDYLRMVEARLDGVSVECAVRFGDPCAEILREAAAFGADLIAVTTAGRGGRPRVALGSVAEQVFRRAEIPVVLFHSDRRTAR
jgi:nucleotide-binding universal stress UspA family protein